VGIAAKTSVPSAKLNPIIWEKLVLSSKNTKKPENADIVKKS
jgi:hypothetical protein